MPVEREYYSDHSLILRLSVTGCKQYALTSLKPDITSFLIKEGADADFIEPDSWGYNKSSLIIYPMLDCEQTPENLALINRCRRLCLEAGADPGVEITQSGGGVASFIRDALDVGTTVTLELEINFDYC